MPDWEEIMRARLRGLGASAEQQSEIASELAGHLEDHYERARLEGLSEDEAAARALVVLGDEAELRRSISRALRGGALMGDWKKSFWVPALFLTAGLSWVNALISIKRYHRYLLALQHPQAGNMVWVSTESHFLLFGTIAPILAGAIGGLWSWRAGGGFWQRLLAGLSLWFAFLATLLISATVGTLQGSPVHHQWLSGWFLYFLRWLTLRQCPYMLLGLFPFLFLKAHLPRAQAHP